MGNRNANPTVTEDPTGMIGTMIREMLEEQFKDLFLFDPIVVEVKTDHEGDDYLHTYIVFDGDFDKLDPGWTVDLSEKLWPHTKALGYPAIRSSPLRPNPSGNNSRGC